MTASIELLYDAQDPSASVSGPAFVRILHEIRNASSSIEIHMYVWRSDAIGNRVGQALLEAAERGVTILIKKDTGAIMYERIEMNRKSFFHTKIPISKALTYKLLRRSFPDSYVADDRTGELGKRLASHPNVKLMWVAKTHTKYYLFDGNLLLTGSINIEDRHYGYHDYMVAIRGDVSISRFRSRTSGKLPPDFSLPIEFLTNTHYTDGGRAFEIKPYILDAITSAQSSLYIEMAYLGDEDVTAAIIRAANRGVTTQILLSEFANIGNDLNFRTAHQIASGSPAKIFITPTMIHSKLMMFDGESVTLGSCNLSVFSLEKAGELNLVIKKHPEFTGNLKSVIASRIASAQEITTSSQLKIYRPLIAALQQLHQKWNPN